MAGGFSIAAEKISELHQFFCKNLAEKITEINAKRNREFADVLELPQVNLELIKELAKLEPYGNGNPRPKFILRDVRKVKANLVGEKKDHISCVFSASSAVGFSGNIQAIAFRAAQTPLAEILLNSNKSLDLVGTFNINSWMGVEKAQMIIEDVLV